MARKRQVKQALDALYAPKGSGGSKIQPISASVASNALTLSLNATSLDFRANSQTSGVINSRTVGSTISLVVPSGATLGTVNGQQARLVLLAIDNAGTISARMQNEKELVELGQLEISLFANPEGLEPIGDNLFVASQRVGATELARPGTDGAGSVAQGFLESSNVQLAEEMVNLVLAQRAYELSAKVIQASDEMLAVSNNLRR